VIEIQTSFAVGEWCQKKKKTEREKFLNQMEGLVPWPRLVESIKPHYPKGQLIRQGPVITNHHLRGNPKGANA